MELPLSYFLPREFTPVRLDSWASSNRKRAQNVHSFSFFCIDGVPGVL